MMYWSWWFIPHDDIVPYYTYLSYRLMSMMIFDIVAYYIHNKSWNMNIVFYSYEPISVPFHLSTCQFQASHEPTKKRLINFQILCDGWCMPNRRCLLLHHLIFWGFTLVPGLDIFTRFCLCPFYFMRLGYWISEFVLFWIIYQGARDLMNNYLCCFKYLPTSHPHHQHPLTKYKYSRQYDCEGNCKLHIRMFITYNFV